MSTDDPRDQDVNAVETRAYRVTDDMRPGDPIPGPKVSPVVDSSCAGCERELSAVRLDLISALGQAAEHEAENARLREALAEVEALSAEQVDDEKAQYGKVISDADVMLAIARDALSATTRKETP